MTLLMGGRFARGSGAPLALRTQLILTVALSGIITLGIASASETSAIGAVTHEYLPEPSEQITKGVPTEGPSKEQVASAGPLSGVNAMAGDAGALYIAERMEGEQRADRLDEFDISTGQFLRQIGMPLELASFHAGIAIGHATGEAKLYVAGAKQREGGEQEGVVSVLDGSGAFQSTWTGAHTLNKSFTPHESLVGELTGVASDNANVLGDWASGDVYVATQSTSQSVFQEFNLVDVFKPEARGGEPAQPVTELRGTCPAEGTTCMGEEVPFGGPVGVAVSGFNSDVLVADRSRETGEDIVDIFEPMPEMPRAYRYLGAIRGTPSGSLGAIATLAVDSSDGDIYVSTETGNVVDEFDAEGKFLGRLSGTPVEPFGEVRGLAVDGGTQRLAVGYRSRETGRVAVFGPNIHVPEVMTNSVGGLTVSGQGEISAVLNGTVDLEHEGPAECWFAWGTSSAFGAKAPCEPPSVSSEEGPAPVHAALTDLTPGTTYYYRLQARNKNGTNEGEALQTQSFMTPGPTLEGEWASEVTATSVTLNAKIDSHGALTSYFFEYGTGVGYGQQTEVRSIALTEPPAAVHVEQHLQQLAAATAYHYRLAVSSELEPGKVVRFYGPDHVFTSHEIGSGFRLPDARAWEMVSPPDKHGALIETIKVDHVIQAATNGAALSYVADAPSEREPLGYSNSVQVLATRGNAGGWTSRDIVIPHQVSPGPSVILPEYQAFSEDLSAALVHPLGPFESDLSVEASEQTPYLRRDFPPGEQWAVCMQGCYRPLVTGKEGYADVQPGTAFGEEAVCQHAVRCGPEFVGASPDLNHVIIRSLAALTPGANSEGALYEWAAGKLALVSILPGEHGQPGGPATNDPELGNADEATRHAVSNDGTRVIWSTNHGEHLYVRDTARGETVQVDAVQPGATGQGSPGPSFQLASSDGSRILFTDGQRLTASAGEGGTAGNEGDLYECAVSIRQEKLACDLTDLTPTGAGHEHARVLDAVIGASEDASSVYFVADGSLTSNAPKGTCARDSEPSCIANLYMWHEGYTRPQLVAVLSGEDAPDWAGRFGGSSVLGRVAARVSPNGRWLAFTSERSLTGYDNTDAVTGKADQEVYVYDGVTGHLACASCNPSGARPVGIEFAKTLDGLDGFEKLWSPEQGLAGSLPTWTTFENGPAFYQPRFMSDTGRVFFNSPEALVRKDANGTGDVYEYEPEGAGPENARCEPAAASGSESFKASRRFVVDGVTGEEPAGCVALISSGESGDEAAFLDASASGGDVFFLTTARLASQDYDESYDVYDAHECTTGVPCPPAGIVSPPECGSSEACHGSGAAQPEVFGPPASSTFSGAGNNVAHSKVPNTGAKLTAARLAKALKACQRIAKRRTRARCVRLAHRRYGGAKASTRTTNGGTRSGMRRGK